MIALVCEDFQVAWVVIIIISVVVMHNMVDLDIKVFGYNGSGNPLRVSIFGVH